MNTKKKIVSPVMLVVCLLGVGMMTILCGLGVVGCARSLTAGHIVLTALCGTGGLFFLCGANIFGCLVWVEDGILHRKGLLFGLKRSCPVEGIQRIETVCPSRKSPTTIYIVDKNPGRYGENATPKSYIGLTDTPANHAFIASFYSSPESGSTEIEPVTHDMSLRKAPFRAVASGKKVIEMRLLDEKRRKIRVGDRIRFTLANGTESVTAEVVGLHPFPSFEALYASLIPVVGAVGLGYAEGDTPDPAHMLDYYSEDSITRYGVVGIEIRVRE